MVKSRAKWSKVVSFHILNIVFHICGETEKVHGFFTDISTDAKYTTGQPPYVDEVAHVVWSLPTQY